MARLDMSEGEKLKKHLGLTGKSFISLSEREQAKIGGRLMEMFHTVSDGALVPLLNFCLEECHVRELCILKGIKTTKPSSSQLRMRNPMKEEPKEEPNDELNRELEDEIMEDSDVDERMAEANADIEAGVWNTREKGHGNDAEVLPLDKEKPLKKAEKDKTKPKPKTERRKMTTHEIKQRLKDFKCPDCGKILKSYASLLGHRNAIHYRVDKADLKCPECGKTFASRGNVEKHREAVHLGVKYACQICDSLFTSKWWVKEHIRTVHKGSKIKNKA